MFHDGVGDDLRPPGGWSPTRRDRKRRREQNESEALNQMIAFRDLGPRRACRRRTHGWKQRSANDGGCDNATEASWLHVLGSAQAENALHIARLEVVGVGRVGIVAANDAIEESRRWQLLVVSDNDDLPSPWRSRPGLRPAGPGWLRRSTARSKSIAPGSRYWATEIGLIIKTGLTACTARPASLNSLRNGRCRRFFLLSRRKMPTSPASAWSLGIRS